MGLSDIVSITISTESAKVLQAGFGTPLILSPHSLNVDRIRTYTNLAGMVTDGFLTTDAEYLAASAIFSQNPRPEELKIGRLANKPTQRWAVTPVVTNSTKYELRVGSTLVSFTSDASATILEIITGLKAAIDALGLAVTVSDQTTFMRIVANTPGAFFSIEATDVSKLGVAQDHADPGVAADLAAIALVDSDWYVLLNLFNSSAMVTAIAAYAEANTKLFLAQTQDSAIITTALAGTDDIGESLKAAAYARTALLYHPRTNAFADAAWAGRVLPLNPGSETWKFKTLATVPAVVLTATHRANAIAKSVNVYETVAGVSITAEGVVSAAEFIDVIRFRDWLQARMQERIFTVVANANKIPFTDGGIAIIEAEVLAQLQDGVDAGGLSNNPAPTVTVPRASAVSAANKAARILPDVKFDAVLAGAIHKLTITGSIRVS